MWTRKELKKKGKAVWKHHILQAAAVCFLLAFLAGEYGGIPNLFTAYDEDQQVENVVETNHQKRENSDVVGDILEGSRTDEGHTLSPAPVEQPASEKKQKYTDGVFASIFNNATRWGSFVFGLVDTVNQGFFKGKIMSGMVMLIGLMISAAYYVLVKNILRVGECRFFLESLTYTDTKVNRLLFVYHVRRTRKTAKTMLVRNIYQFLWDLTLVGGWIKHYSYLMIPYLLAENPEMETKEAFAMSRKMMQGNKWKAFVLDISYFWWYLLGIATLGISDMLFLNPYISASRAALYMQLRGEMLEKEPETIRVCNDIYLNCPPEWEEDAGHSYPYALFTIPEQERRQWLGADYRRDYTLQSYILLFFTFSGIGWLWEVALYLVEDGILVNRGVLYGPWLPIYGSGGVLILFLLKKVRENVPLTFLLTVTVCGTVEYFTSWFLEVTKHMKWWDYSGYFLHINGRVCAEGLLVFGVGGCVFIYFAAPLLDEFYKKIPKKVQMYLCIGLICVFAVDMAYSHFYPNTGKGITDFDKQTKTEMAGTVAWTGQEKVTGL